ncbi:MAG: 5'/3'-nucleotidase SurE [Anaerolineales bacterium]
MRIIIANDDGFYSPGIHALANAASDFGEVLIMAPDGEQSAMSHAITIQRPLHYHPIKIGSFDAYRVNGTPADCVALGLYHWGGADLILSGINLGSNLGHDIWHSGTVAAAKQAAFFGVRAAAFSLDLNGQEPDFEALMPHVKFAIEELLEEGRPMLVNVNFPQNPQGVLWTHQSVRSYNGQIMEGEDPRGRKHFWFGAVPLTDTEEGSDRWAVEHNYVSMTPLRLDLTEEKWLQQLRKVEVAFGR